MGRFKEDFRAIAKGMGLNNAFRFVLIPRVMSRLGSNSYTESKVVDRFITEKFGYIVNRYKGIQLPKDVSPIPNIIWVFWWQGEENMPAVIQECYQSILRNANGREVRLLTKENHTEYVELPEFIMKKFKLGIISFPHFSDILRVQLLIKYGGLWIDSAAYVTKPIVVEDCHFFSPKVSMSLVDTPHMSQWVMSVMAVPLQMPLFLYIYDMLMAYWEKYDTVFAYLMFDYFIRYGYEHLSWVKNLIDNRPLSSPDFFSTRYTFNQEVDELKLDCLIKNNTFLSLTYRIPYPLIISNGKETYYSALLRKCKPNNEHTNRT